jgi:putative transposase
VIVDFIREFRDHRDPGGLRWGIEPICQVLTEHGVPIAPSTYDEWRDKLPTARQARDERLRTEIMRVFKENMGVFGARKTWPSSWPRWTS